MDILRSHYLPLGPALRPCLPALMLSLLPGMDEETSEFYQPVRDNDEAIVSTAT